MPDRPSRRSAVESTYSMRAKLWRWAGGKASWYFLTLPRAVADEIRLVDAGPRRVGFGSLRVQATIGPATWETSIFPSTEHESYLLPVKAAVRKAAGLVEGRLCEVTIRVRRAA